MQKFTMIFLFYTLFLQSCVNKVNHHGYIFDKSMISQVKIGSTTKEEVINIFGTPSDQSSFGQDSWYYISYQTLSHTFRQPKISQAQILTITFVNDIVKSINNSQLDHTSIAQLNLEKERTESINSSQHVISHFMKNFGKYNGKGALNRPRKPSGI